MDSILEYEKLVYSIINKYKNFDHDDLYQVGMMGLMKAYKKFDITQETKFSTYAYYYILGEVNTYVTESNTIKVSKDLIKLNQSIEKAKEVMRQRLKREPTTTEVSLFLEIDEEKIEQAKLAANTQQAKSLDYEFEEENTTLYNSIKTEDTQMNANILDLKNAISDLDPEEKTLIIARYYNDLTQQETSKSLGMSQVQVSRKETKILQKLKATL